MPNPYCHGSFFLLLEKHVKLPQAVMVSFQCQLLSASCLKAEWFVTSSPDSFMCSMLERLHKLQGLHTDIVFVHESASWASSWAVSSCVDHTVFTLEICHCLKMRKMFLKTHLSGSRSAWPSPPLLWRAICICSLLSSSLTGSASSGPLVQCQNRLDHSAELFRIPKLVNLSLL